MTLLSIGYKHLNNESVHEAAIELDSLESGVTLAAPTCSRQRITCSPLFGTQRYR